MRRRLISFILAAALVATMTAPALAGPSRMSFSSTLIDTVAILPPEGPGSNWLSDGVLHVRGATVEETVVGDLAGSLERRVGFNLNLVTGHSTAWCSFLWSSEVDTWEGRCRGSLLSGTLVARGQNGTLMFATYELAPGGVPAVGPYVIIGEILDPGRPTAYGDIYVGKAPPTILPPPGYRV